MKYINNNFVIENVNLQKLANKFKTPIYCYSYNKLRHNINNFKSNFKSFSPIICFAVKANSNLKIIKEIKKLGLGADVVSKGELMTALKAGVNSKKIVFSGVGKTSSELNVCGDIPFVPANGKDSMGFKSPPSSNGGEFHSGWVSTNTDVTDTLGIIIPRGVVEFELGIQIVSSSITYAGTILDRSHPFQNVHRDTFP